MSQIPTVCIYRLLFVKSAIEEHQSWRTVVAIVGSSQRVGPNQDQSYEILKERVMEAVREPIVVASSEKAA